MVNTVYVTDVIKDDYKNWNNNDIIFINASTGCGKSHFIKNTLYTYAKENNKKILFLSNRDNLKQQNKTSFGENDTTILCENYQKIDYQNASDIRSFFDGYIWLSDFDYIVMDECDYAFRDSNFNRFSEICLHNVLQTSKPVKIFMTATPRLILKYLKDKNLNVIEYEIKKDYTSYIEDVVFFYDEKLIEENLLVNLNENEKVIYFNRSAKLSYELHCKFKNSSFICSKYNKEYSQYINKEELDNIIQNECFTSQILFTTLCMDNGVNIKDKNIKHIIVNADDIDTIIQCVGRYRNVFEDNKITLYIKARGNQSLGGIISTCENKLKYIYALEKLGSKMFIETYPRENYGDVIFDALNEDDEIVKCINEAMKVKLEDRKEIAQMILDMKTKYGFCDFVFPYFQMDKDYIVYDELYQKQTLDEYLNTLVGKRLFKDDQKILKSKFEEIGLKDKTMGINTLNGKIKDMKLNYEIISNRCVVDKKKVTYWYIIKK